MFNPKFYNRVCWWSTFLIFILFFLGGLVRSTGAGMGCPDWPKCFGQWVPPTSVEELPADYEEIFLEKRKAKVNRLVQFLQNIGKEQKAQEIAQASWLMQHDPYSFTKAYTEYINRVFGALTGVFSLLCLVSSFQFLKTKKTLTVLSILGLVFVVFNGWLGSIVVDTNLFGGIVTLHFAFAFLAFACYILAYNWGKKIRDSTRVNWFITATIGMFAILIAEVLVGSRVREIVDHFTRSGTAIDLTNYGLLGSWFTFHRIASMVLLFTSIWLFMQYRKRNDRITQKKYAVGLLVVFVLQISAGASNLSFNFPSLAQIAHITLGAAAFGLCLQLVIGELKIAKQE